MDIMMPEMDGYESTQRIRALCGDQWIPIIFMSAKISVDDQVKGLDVGGDDYLTKPVNLKILDAKIKAMQRIAEMRLALSAQAEELGRYRVRAEEEKQLARDLMAHMTRAGSLANERLDTWLLPAEQMSGDLVAVSQTRDGRLYAMLADATGHGLLAAMMQLPVSQTFYAMADKGFSLSSMVAAMNSQLRHLVPRDRFVAAVLVMIDPRNQFIEIWNGGAPEVLFLNQARQIEQRFISQAQPLGVMQEDEFNAATRVYQWTAPGELVIYSDGALDALDADGRDFGRERLEQTLMQAGAHTACAALQQALQDFLHGRRAHDDISVVSIRCGQGRG
jgi:serine phosphatase RsbU (regulator of sigma subunit)